MAEIECARQQGPVADLAPGPGPHEAPQMRIQGAIVLCRLHLETPERTDLALDSDDLLDRFRPERSDHFVFEILAAGIEAEAFSIGSTQGRGHHAFAYRAQKVSFFRKVVQAGQAQPKSLHAKTDGKPMCVGGAADGQDDDGHGREIQPDAVGQRFNRGLITPTFDQHDRVGVGFGGDALRAIEAQRRARPFCEVIVQISTGHSSVACSPCRMLPHQRRSASPAVTA